MKTDSLRHLAARAALPATFAALFAPYGCGTSEPALDLDMSGHVGLVDLAWAPAADLAQARRRHAAVLLPSGRVLVAGGFGTSGGGVPSAQRFELYTPATDTWSSLDLGAGTFARADHTATLLADGQVLLVGGSVGSGFITESELYGEASGWTLAPSLVPARHRHTATLLPGGDALIAGGSFGSSSLLAEVKRYTPATNVWNPARTMNSLRSLHTATLLRTGAVLVTGGDRVPAGGFFSWETTELYDPTANTWTAGPAMYSQRTQHTATLLNDGRVLVAGYAAEAEIYDPTVGPTGSFTSAGAMIVAPDRFRHAATLLPNGCVLVAGGQIGAASSRNFVDDTELFDPRDNRWSRGAPISSPRSQLTATSLPDGSVLLVGGETSTAPPTTPVVERFVLGAIGDACAASCECQSGFCADGVCCNTACDGACDACAVAAGAASDGSCIPVSGVACDDGDGCTTGETCDAGRCVGGGPTSCSPIDACHEAGVCDPASGLCSTLPKPDGVMCDDGNGCTPTDACQAGVCTGAGTVPCQPLDLCHDAGTCDPATGLCDNPTKAEGDPCNDGTGCTEGGTCLSGVCTGATLRPCQPVDSCHDAGVCDLQTGACSAPAKDDDVLCNDEDQCTEDDRCHAGACSGSPKTCPALDECHFDGVCAPETGDCLPIKKPLGTPCDGGVCLDGRCVRDAESPPPAGTGGAGGGTSDVGIDPGCACRAAGGAPPDPGAAALALLSVSAAAITGSRAARRRRRPAPARLR